MQNHFTDGFDLWTSALTKSAVARAIEPNKNFYGIQKLRELILQLAARGKLLPQDPSDEPASLSLARVGDEREQLVATGKSRRIKAPLATTDADRPFRAPSGWTFVRLGDVVLSIMSGGTPSKHNPAFWNGEIPWASVKDLGVGKPLSDTQDRITKAGLEAGSCLAPAGSILVCTRMGLGKVGETLIDVAINQDLKALTLASALTKQYFVNFYKTVSITGTGTTVAGIRQEELLNLVVPLPPVAEQHRIVAKVDELMALCDRLGQQQAEAIDAHRILVETLLGILTRARSREELNDAWIRIASHFDTVFTTEHSIDQLKQTVLQLAVLGKLVRQDPNDEPASTLLARIAERKRRLMGDGDIRKQKSLPEIEEQADFELPKGWKWCRLQDIVYLLGDGLHGTPDYTPNESVYFVNGNNLSNGKIVIKLDTKTVARDQYRKHRKPLGENTVLVSINGTLGNVAFYNNEEIILGKSVCFFNLGEDINKRFVKVVIDAPSFRAYAHSSATGTTIKNLGLAAMNSMPIALPPKDEQVRIADKVQRLIVLCDALRRRLTEVQAIRVHLADATVERSFT